MFKHVLFLSIFLYILNKGKLIEGIDERCCEEIESEFTKGFHNSTCVYSKDEDGNNIPVGLPKPIARCFSEDERSKRFGCDRREECSEADEDGTPRPDKCTECSKLCPDPELDKCVPTIRKDKESYKEGGYCTNSSCETITESNKCSGTCHWTGSKCESKKYEIDGDEKKKLNGNFGVLLNYENSEKYKTYARGICDPFKGTKFEQGDLDEKWSSNDYTENIEDTNWLYIVPASIVGILFLFFLWTNRDKLTVDGIKKIYADLIK